MKMDAGCTYKPKQLQFNRLPGAKTSVDLPSVQRASNSFPQAMSYRQEVLANEQEESIS